MPPLTPPISREVEYKCGDSDLIWPREADNISLSTSKEGMPKYLYNDQECLKCTRINMNSMTKPDLSEIIDEKAKFSCGHRSSQLPLKGRDIRLRWTSKGQGEDLPYYEWAIKCYNCHLEYVCHEDRVLEHHYHYTTRKVNLKKEMAVLEERITSDHRDGIFRNADMESHPLNKKIAILLKKCNELEDDRATRQWAYWKPFQKLWGADKDQEHSGDREICYPVQAG